MGLSGMWKKCQCGPFVTWTKYNHETDPGGLYTYKYRGKGLYKFERSFKLFSHLREPGKNTKEDI